MASRPCEHKRQVGSILEALGDDSWLLQTLIEIRHLPIVARVVTVDLIVLIQACYLCCKRTGFWSFSEPAPSITPMSHLPQFRR